MSPAPSPQPDPISALMRRLAVLLAGWLGSLLAELLAERDALAAGDARLAEVMGRIAAVRRLQALVAAEPEEACAEFILVPAPWRLVHSLRLGHRVIRGGRGVRDKRGHPRPLHPPNAAPRRLRFVGNRPQGGAVLRP
ncbi:MAG: hypothetical protein NT133_08340 [Alphaproteobacteria bacterium]|nr:hypothetical protein [Alphaproteobacteria bacterium]